MTSCTNYKWILWGVLDCVHRAKMADSLILGDEVQRFVECLIRNGKENGIFGEWQIFIPFFLCVRYLENWKKGKCLTSFEKESHCLWMMAKSLQACGVEGSSYILVNVTMVDQILVSIHHHRSYSHKKWYRYHCFNLFSACGHALLNMLFTLQSCI